MMSVLGKTDERVSSPSYYEVGDMTYVPGGIDENLLHQKAIEVVGELWPARKLYYMRPEAIDLSPRNVLILSSDLKDHSIDSRQMLIWKTETNIVPAICTREGVVVSLTGANHRALINLGWREAVYGAISYFINRWESAGEDNDIDSCYLTPYVTAEKTELAGVELEIAQSTQLGRFIRPLEDTGMCHGLDLSLAVKFQLECWLGLHQVIIVHSVANHFGRQPICCTPNEEHANRAADPPASGVYLGLCS